MIKEIPRKYFKKFNYKILISDDSSNENTVKHMINIYWTRAIEPGSDERHFISKLRFDETVFLNKDID